MTRTSSKSRRAFSLLGKLLFSILAVGMLTSLACPQVSDTRPSYDVTPRRLDMIPPGTVIDKGPPRDWSNLIIKSHPRVGAGDVTRLSQSAADLAGLLTTVIVANVQGEPAGGVTRYRLAGLAVGLTARIKGKDVIVSPATQQELGAGLGFTARIVLSKAYEKLQEVQLVARSDTMVLFDAPALLQRDGKHDAVVLRYAVLVEASTGRLDTLLCVIDREERGGYKGAAATAEWLPPGKLEDCVLHVDGKEFSLGVPSEKAFAMNRLPQGQKQLNLPDDVRLLAGRLRLSHDMAFQIETRLRELLKQAAR
jgi:hypothetical protein